MTQSITFTEDSKFYQLELHQNCENNCSYCPRMGMKSQTGRSISDLDRSLTKASANQHDTISLPCNLLSSPEEQKPWLDNLLNDQSFKKALNINLDGLEKNAGTWSEMIKKSHFVSFISDDVKSINWGVFNELCEASKSFELLFVITNKANLLEQMQAIPGQYHARIRFYAPIRIKAGDSYFSTKKLHRELSKVARKFPAINIATGFKRDLFEPRVPLDMELMSTFSPSSFSSKRLDAPEFSIIIPSYNHKVYLMRTLENLIAQDFAKAQYEIIIVDDGGSDGTDEEVKALIQKNPDVNIQYIKFLRYLPRTMGDGRFRAGLSRNQGIQHAKGKFVFFLDSDVLLPKDALTTIQDDLKEASLIQIKRYDLNEEFTKSGKEIELVDFEKDLIHVGREYWHDFFSRGQSWDEWDNKWKYVCTYGLILSRKLLDEIGWIRKTYTFYGFEDTEIGYQVALKNQKYKLSNVTSYHQFHGKERSEFFNRQGRRQKVLARTAKVFYHNNLKSDIFKELSVYMKPDYSLFQLLLSKFGIRF
jgi:glycosyltransferase involved in cell wall biosynthesis